MVARKLKQTTMPWNPKVNFPQNIRKKMGLVLLAGMVAGLWSGCSSTQHNRRVYDRYAELVAERNRAQTAAVAPAPAATGQQAAVSRPVAAGTTTVSTPATAPAPTPRPEIRPVPVQVIQLTGTAPKPAPTVAAPAPKPAPAVAAVAVPAAVPAPAPVSAAASVPAPAPAVVESAAVSAESPDGTAYTLKVGDSVQIFLRGIPNAEAIEGIIDEHGGISLPFINEVKAAGQTASELARSVRQIYLDQGIYRNISVNVVVPTRYYFMQGEIRQPGRFQILSATRVSQAIAAAGGYTEFASGQVQIKRGGKIVKTIRNAKRIDRTPDDDIMLEPDDIVDVRRSLW